MSVTKEQCIEARDSLVEYINRSEVGESLKKDLQEFIKFTHSYLEDSVKFIEASEKTTGKTIPKDFDSLKDFKNVIDIKRPVIEGLITMLQEDMHKDTRRTCIETIQTNLQDVQHILDTNTFLGKIEKARSRGTLAESGRWN